jgi:hypothetical protein
MPLTGLSIQQKCDGDRPSCGQCAKSNGSFEDCEFPGPGPTQVQLLEERISQVQERIRRLESGAESTTHAYSGPSYPSDGRVTPRTPPQASSGSSHSGTYFPVI